MIETLLYALGVVMVFEGLVYLLAPSVVEHMLNAMRVRLNRPLGVVR